MTRRVQDDDGGIVGDGRETGTDRIGIGGATTDHGGHGGAGPCHRGRQHDDEVIAHGGECSNAAIDQPVLADALELFETAEAPAASRRVDDAPHRTLER